MPRSAGITKPSSVPEAHGAAALSGLADYPGEFANDIADELKACRGNLGAGTNNVVDGKCSPASIPSWYASTTSVTAAMSASFNRLPNVDRAHYRNRRISTLRLQCFDPSAASLSATARSGAAIIQKPATYSFDST